MHNAETVPMYVINLRHRQDRYASFMNEITASGLNLQHLQRFEAVNSKAMTDSHLQQVVASAAYKKLIKGHITRDFHAQLTVGAVGCYLSHLEIMQRFLHTNAKYCIIFEDDCVLQPRCALAINRVLRKLEANEPDFDMLLLGSIVPPPPEVYSHPHVKTNEYARIQRFYGTHAYVLSRAGAKQFLQGSLPMTKQLDSFMSDVVEARSMKVYLMVPMVAFQDGVTDTNIQTPCVFCGPLKQTFVVKDEAQRDRVVVSDNLSQYVVCIIAALAFIFYLYKGTKEQRNTLNN
jgi:glycosyl transferase, family 25